MTRPTLRFALRFAALVAPALLAASIASAEDNAAGIRPNPPSKPGEPRRPPPQLGAIDGPAAPPPRDRGVIGGQGASAAPPAALTSEDGVGDYGYIGAEKAPPPTRPAVGAASDKAERGVNLRSE